MNEKENILNKIIESFNIPCNKKRITEDLEYCPISCNNERCLQYFLNKEELNILKEMARSQYCDRMGFECKYTSETCRKECLTVEYYKEE